MSISNAFHFKFSQHTNWATCLPPDKAATKNKNKNRKQRRKKPKLWQIERQIHKELKLISGFVRCQCDGYKSLIDLQSIMRSEGSSSSSKNGGRGDHTRVGVKCKGAKRFIILTWRWECVNWLGQLFVFISSAARLIVSNERRENN